MDVYIDGLCGTYGGYGWGDGWDMDGTRIGRLMGYGWGRWMVLMVRCIGDMAGGGDGWDVDGDAHGGEGWGE